MVESTTDDLMAELNGGLPPLVDAPSASPSRDELLTVKPAPTASPAERIDAVHATRAGGKGYRVTVRGNYFAYADKGKVKKDFSEIAFNLPQAAGALSVIKGRLLDVALKKKYPDFAGARECFIVDVTPLSAETPASRQLEHMSREQLVNHIEFNRIPIAHGQYPDIVHLREAVVDYTLTPNGFEKREAEKQKGRQEERELLELNPELA